MPCLGARKKSKTAGGNAKNKVNAAQLQQDLDRLKSKNDRNINIIAAQTEELDRLRQQISEQSNNTNTSNNENLVVLRLRNRQTLEALLEKEKLLQQRDNELEVLREVLEEERKAQQIESMDIVVRPVEQRDDEQFVKKELELSERERQLEDDIRKWELERAEVVKPALEEVEEQLRELKLKNNEILARLSDRERELERLQVQPKTRRHSIMNDDQAKKFHRLTMDVESDKFALQKIQELAADLKAQKFSHQALLDSHAETIAEKDKLLQEQHDILSKLQQSHDSATSKLLREQKQSLSQLEEYHKREMEKLQSKLTDAEKRTVDVVDSEVEKVLHEFELAEHSHTMKVEELERSHKNQISMMARDQKQQLRVLKSRQHDETKRISWRPSSGIDQGIVTLRSTGGPGGSCRRVPTMIDEPRSPDLTPRDKKKVQVYVSSICSNLTIKQRQEHIGHVLSTNNIKFEVIDVAASQPALQYMKRQNNGGSTRGRAKELPQVFVGGQYRGQYQDLINAVDQDDLKEFLQCLEKGDDINMTI
ncbi:SH3-binding, glutamic acid-rich protein-domain-containing protein [Umbelopsis sp. AD052]|nr:SH3-binding, glutamic acid-rich protein-domain-containing protein [Umbelopsis sp. AD052]